MPKYRVAVCFEEAVVIDVEAQDADQAEEFACLVAGEHAGSEYPPHYNPDTVHRDFFSQDAKEITND